MAVVLCAEKPMSFFPVNDRTGKIHRRELRKQTLRDLARTYEKPAAVHKTLIETVNDFSCRLGTQIHQHIAAKNDIHRVGIAPVRDKRLPPGSDIEASPSPVWTEARPNGRLWSA